MAAQMINVRLSRVDAQPWGLRLQGGKDFGTPLVIQKVNMGSIADQAGLNAGDSVISVNNVDVYNLRHKDAQDIIVRSGNSFDITVQRGGSTWRPHVTPTGTVPSPTPMYGGGGGGGPVNTVTKTSLAHKQPQQDSHIGCGYNNAARPFSSQNGGPVQSIVNKQYNTPVGMYSEESIAETLSAQAEVLAGGVLGVNFKKNEKVYNSAGSEVLKALQESENDPADPADPNFFWTASHAIGGHCSKSRSQTPSQLKYSGVKLGGDTPINVCTEQKSTVCQSVGSSSTSTTQMSTNNNEARTKSLSSPVPSCDECGTTIVGVFVRIKDKNLHVDCFKCATCGTSLKNQGYFNLNNKLYCDIHAKMAAINNPPPGTEGFRPVPIQPNTKLSANTISAALNAHHPSQNGFSQNHDNVITQQSHSRTSSSASSVGSSYQSSTDSSKASPSKSSSPIHTRKGSHSNVQHQDNNNEWHKNGNSTDATDNKSTTTIINSNSKNNNGILPHYQIKLSTKYDAEDDDNITNSNNVKISDLIHELEDNLNPTTKATMNGIHKNVITDNNNHDNVPDSIYGTIRPHNKNRFNDDGGDDEFNYITLGGRTIRSVHPPGKGKHIQYKVNSNIGAPKPFGISNVPRSTGGPPMAGPKSPSSYPPSTNPSVWATQPKQPSTFASPKLTTANYNNSSNYLSNTLPRAVSKAAPDYDDEFVDEVSQTSTYNFCWPPPPEDDTLIPTATPLYIPPPGTQHIKSKQYMLKSKTKESKRNADEEEEEIWTQSASQQMTKQSKSAPELTAQNLKQHQHYMENSESYTSTSSTTATSDEYQKIYPPPSTTSIYGLTTSYGGQSQCNFYSNKSNSEFDYNSVDMELASMHQQYQQKNEYYSSTAATSKTATDYLSFSGRRSAQECSDYLTDTLTNCQIIDYINHVPLCSTSEIPPSVQSQDSIKLYDSYSQELYEAESQSKSLHLSFPPVAPQFMRQSISPVIPKYQSDSEIKSLPKANVQSFPPVLQPSSVATAQSEQPKQTVSTSEIAVSQTVPSTCSTLTSPCKSLKKVEFSNSITEFRSTKNAQEQELTKSMDCKIKELQECHPNKHLAIERKPTLPPSNIQNSTPKEWTSLMVRALTTASDKSYSISGVKFDPNKKNENSSSEDQIVIKPEEIDSKNKIEPPPINILTEKPPAGSLMSSALTTAASQPVEWIKSEGGIIPLPTETVPYMPPPISMEPIIKEDYRTKSPFVEALTIVSDRSYTPFEHDVITQLDDLPRPPKEPLHLIDALTVAPENTYGTCKSDLPVSEKFESKSIDTQWKSQNFEEVISKTTMEKPSQSAFAQVKGFRSVDPFKPRTVTLEMLQEQEQQLVKQKQELVLQQKQNVDEQQVKDHQQQLDVQQYQEGTFQIRDEALVQSHNTHTETISRKTQSRQCHMTDQNQSQSISFPPPPGVKVKSFVQSGLHIPNTIPKYQRQWYNLPSQSPVRTPEPPELKINVPLAFLDIPHEQSDSVEKPLAVNATCTSVVNESATSNIVVAAVNASVADATTVITESLTESSSISHSEMKMKEETKSLSTSETVTTANTNNLIVDRSHPITMTFQSLDLPDLNDVSVNQKRVTSSPPPPPPSSTTVFPRPHTPSSSVINKPAPTIPYYQQNLVAEKCSASESHLFDPHLNSPSPHPDRTKSPAPGPPPNPLKIQAPRIKSPTAEKSLPIYSQMNYSNVQTEYLPNYSNGTISQTQDRPFDNYQSLAESGQRTFIDRPETFEQRQTTDGLNVQMRSKEQELNEQNRSNYESSVTQQFGNTQVQRKTRVVEEFEHTQKAKNIEIRKYSGNDPSMTKSITQPQQFSITDGERKIVTKQQQSQQPYGKVFYDHGYGKTGFVNSQTRRLSANSQYKSDLANYESHFPELSSPAPSPTQFPIRNFHPILEEPKVQSYNVLLRERTPEPTTTPTAQFSTLPLQPISSCNSNTSYCPTQSATVSSTSTLSSSHHQQIQNQTYNEMDFSKSSQKQIHNDSYLSSTLTNPKTPTAAATTKTLTTPSVPPPNPSMFKGPSQLSTTTPNNNNSYPIPLPYIKSHQTANDFMQNQNALNFKPTSTSDSGFRPSNTNTNPSAVVTDPSPASAGSNKGLTFGATSAPKRGRGIINKAALPGGRIPQCGCCNAQIRHNVTAQPPLPTTIPPSPVNLAKEPQSPNNTNHRNDETYVPGHATNLLEKSVQNLKISEQENFKNNAGKIISLMLESRINEQNNTNGNNNHNNDKNINGNINNINNKNHINNNISNEIKINGGNGKIDNKIKNTSNLETIQHPMKKLLDNGEVKESETKKPIILFKPPPPPPPPITSSSIVMPTTPSTTPIKTNKTIATPPPPPPPPLSPKPKQNPIVFRNFNKNKNLNNIHNQTLKDKPINGDHQIISKKVPVLANVPENLLTQISNNLMKSHPHVTDNGKDITTDSNIINRQSPESHSPVNFGNNNSENGIVFRNKKTQPERIAHAFDRRSYIEKDSSKPIKTITKIIPNEPEPDIITSTNGKDGDGPQEKPVNPICCHCNIHIKRGPFITALGRIWCPDHFVCVNANCRRPLQDIGFVEEKGDLYCEYCFEKYLAPPCDKCGIKIKGDCLNAIGKHFHPECFTCTYCGKLFGNSPFFLEEGQAYCENDWNELFTTKCFACGFPVEAGDRWVEALSHNYHSQCFNCTACKKNLEGQSFYAKGGRPFCKNHAR